VSEHDRLAGCPRPFRGLIAALILGLAPLISSPALADPGRLNLPDFSGFVEEVRPAVVNIRTTSTVTRNMPQFPFGDFFAPFLQQRPGTPRPAPKTYKSQSLGTGFIISSDGYIVTNNHVIDDADEIVVRLADDREFPAKVIGHDEKTDVALIKVEASGLPQATLGDSDKVKVGQWCLAIGNPFGFSFTVTAGIVSAVGRDIGEGPYDNFIQTDAAINPGNSGGPLFDTDGRVIGMNTAIYSRSGGYQGIGFAIPVNMVTEVIDQLRDHGSVVRGYLGVNIQEVTKEMAEAMELPSAEGALVAQVMEGTPAAKAGIKAGDVVVSFEGHPIKRSRDLPRLVATASPGSKSTLEVIRDGKRVKLKIEIGTLPEEMAQSGGGGGHSGDSDRFGLRVAPITTDLMTQFHLPADAKEGVLVVDVSDGSPAADAGLQPGDRILKVGPSAIASVKDLVKVLAGAASGKVLLLRVARGENKLFLPVRAP